MQQIITSISEILKREFKNEATGHDWWHIYRVWNTSKHIAQKEGGNVFIVELGALLHDIADWKFHNGDENIGPAKAEELLKQFNIEEETIEQVKTIIREISFKGAGVETPMSSLEGKIVQDADRLDAIGAIGIARTFAYGGAKGNEMYNPETKPEMHQSFEAYKNSSGSTINHFYEKLLLLKDRMNTKTGKVLAEKRHLVMEDFLTSFYNEWEINKFQ